MSSPPLDRLREVSRGFPEARLVVLFGSVARGDAVAWSDADIGVSGLAYWRGLELGAELGRLVGLEPHVVDLDGASDWLRFRVAAEGIPLSEGEPDAWAKFVASAMLSYFDLAPIIEVCAAGARRALGGETSA